jgi:acetate kinase
MRTILRDVPNVAVFDTSFHSSIPLKVHTYPLPAEYRSKGIRKWGFHGTSVHYCSQKATEVLDKELASTTKSTKPYQMVVCHLGNGASVTAVSGDKSMETSMGFTPLTGLMMGTRCGDVDPSVVSFACHQLQKNVDEVLSDMNKKSGFKGMTSDGENDMRELLARNAKGDEEAILAVDMFVFRLAQNIAKSLIALERPLDALVFTAGIGEHSCEIRQRTILELSKIIPSLALDDGRNKTNGENTNGVISMDGCQPTVIVIATDEEAMIAKECIRLVGQVSREI